MFGLLDGASGDLDRKDGNVSLSPRAYPTPAVQTAEIVAATLGACLFVLIVGCLIRRYFFGDARQQREERHRKELEAHIQQQNDRTAAEQRDLVALLAVMMGNKKRQPQQVRGENAPQSATVPTPTAPPPYTNELPGQYGVPVRSDSDPRGMQPMASMYHPDHRMQTHLQHPGLSSGALAGSSSETAPRERYMASADRYLDQRLPSNSGSPPVRYGAAQSDPGPRYEFGPSRSQFAHLTGSRECGRKTRDAYVDSRNGGMSPARRYASQASRHSPHYSDGRYMYDARMPDRAHGSTW